MLAQLLPTYPDIKAEIVVDYGVTDIVAERLDAACDLAEPWGQRQKRLARGASEMPGAEVE